MSPAECFAAQLTGTSINPDVGGIIIGVSNIVINAILPILLAFSSDSADTLTAVYMLYSQILPILIAVIASIGGTSLTLFDAKFGISLTASPVSIYITYSTLRLLLGIRSTLFERLDTDRYTKVAVCGPALVIPALWISLAFTISFSSTAFKGSNKCGDMTLSAFFRYMANTFFLGSLAVLGNYDMYLDLKTRGGLGAVAVIVLWFYGAYTVGHLRGILETFKRRIENHTGLIRPLRWMYVGFQVPLSIWEVIAQEHPWFPYAVLACLYWSWILHMARGLITTGSLSYGQVLSIFSVVPPALAVLKLLRRRQTDLSQFLCSLPSAFLKEVLFFLIGRPTTLPSTETQPTAISTSTLDGIQEHDSQSAIKLTPRSQANLTAEP